MTEYRMMKLCAEAMGWRTHAVSSKIFYCPDEQTSIPKSIWNPLKDDSQAMMLVRKFKLVLRHASTKHGHEGIDLWLASFICDPDNVDALNINLNRAIVECVATMHSERHDAAHGRLPEEKS